ncbi:MAG: hypothetical protein JXQ73_09010 [Phycisphaerae bacterium]|nr:hypothetical protein [Phycisphaerae bacterium]
MGLAFKRFKTYAKLVVMVTIAVAVLLVIFMNRNNKVDVWLFHEFPQANVLWVMLISGASVVAITWAMGRFRRVLHEVRELRHANEMESKLAEQRRIAAELKEQESRIDAKIQGVISQPGESSHDDETEGDQPDPKQS